MLELKVWVFAYLIKEIKIDRIDVIGLTVR